MLAGRRTQRRHHEGKRTPRGTPVEKFSEPHEGKVPDEPEKLSPREVMEDVVEHSPEGAFRDPPPEVKAEVSGLTPELTAFALAPVRILVPIPALSVILSLQRAVLIQARKTHPITVATSIEVMGIAILFVALGWGLDLVGVTAAFLAFLGGRTASVLYLVRSAADIIRKASPVR